jgi:molybdate transport system substrate-binding protein
MFIVVLMVALFVDGMSLQAQDEQTLVVFAAASLTNVLEEAATGFEAANPGVDVRFNFAGSSDLVAQLSEGAPADVFASADIQQMQAATEVGRIPGEAVIFARNRLALIVPVDNPARIIHLEDVAQDGVRLILAAEGVPIRQYTNLLLERLAADPAYGEEFRQAVLSNVVSEEQNVRQVAAKVALGEADAGFVYATDVTPDIAGDVIVIPIPEAHNPVVTYPIAVTDDSARPEVAQAFIDYLLSEDGQAVLVKWHFMTAHPPRCNRVGR